MEEQSAERSWFFAVVAFAVFLACVACVASIAFVAIELSPARLGRTLRRRQLHRSTTAA